jgi:hypothetical protein
MDKWEEKLLWLFKILKGEVYMMKSKRLKGGIKAEELKKVKLNYKLLREVKNYECDNVLWGFDFIVRKLMGDSMIKFEIKLLFYEFINKINERNRIVEENLINKELYLFEIDTRKEATYRSICLVPVYKEKEERWNWKGFHSIENPYVFYLDLPKMYYDEVIRECGNEFDDLGLKIRIIENLNRGCLMYFFNVFEDIKEILKWPFILKGMLDYVEKRSMKSIMKREKEILLKIKIFKKKKIKEIYDFKFKFKL